MPELPDVTVYIEALERPIGGELLNGIRLASPFLLRTVAPARVEAVGRRVRTLRRIGKRIAIGLDGDLWLVLHLMIAGLHAATGAILEEWTEALRRAAGDGFPAKVTAFRDGMAVHGRYGQPCPACGTKVQRIRYASNETNYCPRCQTGGKLLADRALSRLLKKDWPRTIDELEQLKAGS